MGVEITFKIKNKTYYSDSFTYDKEGEFVAGDYYNPPEYPVVTLTSVTIDHELVVGNVIEVEALVCEYEISYEYYTEYVITNVECVGDNRYVITF